jgi:hypothetical protein
VGKIAGHVDEVAIGLTVHYRAVRLNTLCAPPLTALQEGHPSDKEITGGVPNEQDSLADDSYHYSEEVGAPTYNVY